MPRLILTDNELAYLLYRVAGEHKLVSSMPIAAYNAAEYEIMRKLYEAKKEMHGQSKFKSSSAIWESIVNASKR